MGKGRRKPSLGAWEPDSLETWEWERKLGAAVQAPHLRAFGACAAWATRVVQSPEPTARESSAVQCGPVQHTRCAAAPAACRRAWGWCVFGCARTVPVGGLANRRTGERSPTGVLRCQGPGVRVKREGREGKRNFQVRSTESPSGLSDQTGQGAAAELQVECDQLLGAACATVRLAAAPLWHVARAVCPARRKTESILLACLLACSQAQLRMSIYAAPYRRNDPGREYRTIHIVFRNSPSRDAGMKKSDPTWTAWRPELPALTSDQGPGARSGDAERAGQASEPMRTRQTGPVCAGQATSMLPPAHGCLAHLGPVAFFFLENMTWTRGPFWKLETHKVDGCTAAGRTESKLPGAGDAVPRAQARHGES